MVAWRFLMAAVFAVFLGCGAVSAQDQPETLPLAIGTEGYKVTVAELEKMPQVRLVTATPFLPGKTTFDGVLLRDLLKAAGISAPRLVMTALNDYSVEIPLSDATDYDVIVAYKVDGQYMRVRDKGPFWLVYPLDQHPELRTEETATKMIWQIKTIAAE